MKVKVNKNQQAINFKKHVYTIIEIAQQTAKKGYTTFYYPKPINQGINTHSLIEAVEQETENSVYGGVQCIKDESIKFSIRD